MKTQLFITIRILSALFVISGFIPILIVTVLDYGAGRNFFVDRHTELALSDLDGIAVDSKGRIYTAIQIFNRIQVYAPNGVFLYGFFVDELLPCEKSFQADFKMYLEPGGTLEVLTYKKSYRFSLNGARLPSDTVEIDEKYRRVRNTTSIQVPQGNEIRVERHFLIPRIVRISAGGQRTTIVAVPPYRWASQNFLFGWFLVVLGAAGSFLEHKLRKQWSQSN